MPRLFVAVGLPTSITTALARLQPPPSAGIRLTPPAQMHLTLHFLGEANLERMASALERATVPAFSLAINGLGRFSSAGGAVTLWAGVRATPELLAAHAAVAAALASEGFQPEARPYTPHITLARCAPEAPPGTVEAFLAQHAGISLPAVPVTTFGLYSSRSLADVPVYECERSFPL